MISEGYDVQYYRVPITPESDFADHTIDSIFKIAIKHCMKPQGMPYFIMNCQMGRGRSTLVTILVWLIFKKLGLIDGKQMQHHKTKSSPDSKAPSIASSPSPSFGAQHPGLSPPPGVRMKLFRVPSTPTLGIRKSNSNPKLSSLNRKKSVFRASNILLEEKEDFDNEHGDYEIINRILRVISNGKVSKQDVDDAIEACGSLYNLKHEMAKGRLKLENSENDDEKELAQYSTTSLLSKYCTLIAFAAFLRSIQLEDIMGGKQYDFEKNSFSSWMNGVPSLQKIRKDIFTLKFDDLIQTYQTKLPQSSNVMLIMNRQGSVLSANTILKADITPTKMGRQKSFRKLKSNEQLQSIKFRYLQDVGIITCAQPPSVVIETILRTKLHLECKGISEENVMDEQKGDNNDNDDEGVEAIWIDLREEPILYIRTRPYVVRNYNRPYQRLPEFDNLLSKNQMDDIAERLKIDLQQEAADNDNKLLVHFETLGQGLKESTLPIDMTNPNEIQTTQQIFDALRSKGYKISYQKLPFNPRNISEFGQLERLGKVIQEQMDKQTTILFNCRQFSSI